MKKDTISEAAKALGKRGGDKTLEKYGREQLAKWGKLGAKFGRLGGRPRKSAKQKGR